MNQYLNIKGISKAFPGVQALKDVSFSVEKGEIHALLGENGAGKSTLIKILGGVQMPDEGSFEIEGQPVAIKNPIDSRNAGIVVMHQEINLISSLDVATNILLGDEPVKKPFGLVDKTVVYKAAEDILKELEFEIPVRKKVSELTFAEKQMIEIARAVSHSPKIIVMDEPSASLTNKERENLYKIIQHLKDQGVSVIYITHLMDEVFRMADRVTVLRDGQYIGTEKKENMDFASLIKMMVGRNIVEHFDRPSVAQAEVVLQVKNLNRKGVLHDINFDLHKGEILGFAGLAGAGRTEIARAVFGADKIDSGEIYISGKRVHFNAPADAFAAGISLVPEDRKTQGLQLSMNIETNIAYSKLNKVLSSIGTLSFAKIRNTAEKYINLFKITPPQPTKLGKFLSGGNQQKVVVSRCIFTDAPILIIDEPTRGMDVGAKDEIHNILHQLACEGKSIIMISSEMPEVLKMSDRLLVIRNGMIVAQLYKSEATQEKVLTYAMGGKQICS